MSFIGIPMMLRLGAFLNIPCFEVFFWLVIAHLLLTLEQNDDARWWLLIGVVAGIALLNKHTTLFLGTGILVGLLFTHRRKDLMSLWLWGGGLIAFVIFLPNLIWQHEHDWVTLEFIQNINASAMSSRVEFVLGQVILMNLANFILFIGGMLFYFRDTQGKRYKILGYIFVTMLILLMCFGAKVYYLLPA